MSDFIDIRRFWNMVVRSWWLIVLVTVVAAAIGYRISQDQPRVYEASTTLLVGQSIKVAEPDSKDIQISQQLAQTYADMARREPVLQAAVEKLGLSETWPTLKKRVAVKLTQDTQLLEITVEAHSPEEAQATADEIARQLILLSPAADSQDPNNDENQRFIRQQIDALRAKIIAGQARVAALEAATANSLPSLLGPPIGGFTATMTSISVMPAPQYSPPAQQIQNEISTLERSITDWQANYTRLLALAAVKNSSNYLAVIEPAQFNPSATRPNTLLNTLVAGGLGLVLVLAFVLVQTGVNNTLNSADDLSRALGITYLGTVEQARGKSNRHKLLASHDPLSTLSDAYQIIRSNIQLLNTGQPTKSIMVTGLASKEATSTLAANLGVVMAQSGFKAIILDTDLRQPLQHQIFEIPRQPGLTDLLSSPNLRIDGCLRNTSVENLKVITSGTAPAANPAELLSSPRMQQLLTGLHQKADVIICDARSASTVADATVLSTQLDGVIFAIEAGETRQDKAKQAISHLHSAGARLLGGVLVLRMGLLRSVLGSDLRIRSSAASWLNAVHTLARNSKQTIRSALGKARAAIGKGSRSHI